MATPKQLASNGRNRLLFAVAVLAISAIDYSCESAPALAHPQAIQQRVMTSGITTTYTVTDPTTFPALSLPTKHSVVFHDGVFAAPVVDYAVMPNGSALFPAANLAVGDTISVVALP